MFSHQVVGSNDLERSRIFYDALFGTLHAGPGVIDPRGRVVYERNGARFIVTRPINGEPAAPANGGTIGFLLDSCRQVNLWHSAGVENGGASCEEPPGVRPGMDGSEIYLAYLRDPDGNKLCGLHRLGSK